MLVECLGISENFSLFPGCLRWEYTVPWLFPTKELEQWPYLFSSVCVPTDFSSRAVAVLQTRGINLSCIRTCVVVAEERPRIALQQSFSKLFKDIGLSPRAVSTTFGSRVNVAICLQVTVVKSCLMMNGSEVCGTPQQSLQSPAARHEPGSAYLLWDCGLFIWISPCLILLTCRTKIIKLFFAGSFCGITELLGARAWSHAQQLSPSLNVYPSSLVVHDDESRFLSPIWILLISYLLFFCLFFF